MSYSSGVRAEDFHPETRQFFQGRTVAVTGGSGFIGSHMVEQLVTLEARVVVPSREDQPRFLRAVRDRIELRRADLTDIASAEKAIAGTTAVLHLAALVGGLEFNMRHPASIFDANIQMFLSVIRASSRQKVDRFLVMSSACVYPRHCSIPTPESEGFVDEPEPTNSGYGWAKRMEEYLGRQYAAEFGLPVAIARPYNAYGPRDNFDRERSHVIPALIRKAFETEDGTLPVWGDGSHSRSFLYVDDFARGSLEVAARYPAADALNIGMNEETSMRELAESIAASVSKIRGRAIRPVFNPSGPTGQPRRLCDTSKASKTLGFQARVPLAEGLQRTVKWFLENENRSLPAHP